MSEDGRRPGGLTALAVLNFVFGGMGVLSSLSYLSPAIREKMIGLPENLWPVLVALGLVESGLMIASGVGYLGLKRVLGRRVGTIYALISLAHVVFLVLVWSGGFGFMVLVGV